MDLYGDRVHNTVLGFVQHQEDAEDLTQEVFIEIIQSIGKFEGGSRLYTWIYRIAVTKSLDHIKARQRKKRFAFLQSLFNDEGLDPKADKPHFDHPGVAMENKTHAQALFLAMEKLPEKQRTAFTLSKVEQLSYAEIAEVMQTSVSSVESLLFRARQQLQELLKGYYEKQLK